MRGSSASACWHRRRSSSPIKPTVCSTGWRAPESTWSGSATSTPHSDPIAASSTTRATTRKEFDPEALNRLDHLIAGAKKRGIYVALELMSKRRFRVEDGVAVPGLASPRRRTGGDLRPDHPQAGARPRRGRCSLTSNPETALALRNDPALAWVTLAGEISLFNLIDNPARCRPPTARRCATWAIKTRR